MTIASKKPPIKLTVGAQYICFNTMTTDGEWQSGQYASDVTKLPTVVSAEISDVADTYDAYASGAIYDTDTDVIAKQIAVENIAFSNLLIAQMRGDTIDGGVIVSGGKRVRPYFAYGLVKLFKDGSKHLCWYPKCKLIENDDTNATSNESHTDQNKSVTIKAFTINDNGDTDVSIDTSVTEYADVTEAEFFATPIETAAEAKALI